MKIIILSLDSGTDAQCAALWNEVERTLGFSNDPLDELIADEEGDDDCFDAELAVRLLNGIHQQVHGRGCSFPQCYKPCNGCKACQHRERVAR